MPKMPLCSIMHMCMYIEVRTYAKVHHLSHTNQLLAGAGNWFV